MANDRIGYFKTLRLGDLLQGPERIRAKGDDPEIVSPLYGNRGVIIDRGGRSHYEVDAQGALVRGYSTTETADQFMQRKLQFLINIVTVRGYVPSSVYGTEGVLAILSDSADLHTTTAPVSAGATTVPITAPDPTYLDGESYFIADGTSYELLRLSAGTGVNLPVAATTYGYASGAIVFKPSWFLRNAFLLTDTQLEGLDPGSNQGVKEIDFKFVSIETPEWF